MDQTIGTCGICEGPVQIPFMWSGLYPPTPTCKKCGATQKAPYGPVIDMEPAKPLKIQALNK